eukprot:CAMPEP_0194064194 /NCGR_PEP_ID=MMETSP0009_2-20130614/82350_1 /TAXON_ID=210454 /ORGANISM="Grammatophora oceanica, Strain CCMP 410" /LENGTH=173 /DNA_ID=CAMNT_0038716591 /DNA_START=115 /DNA_END=632 /DNA_ORIENTATION=+
MSSHDEIESRQRIYTDILMLDDELGDNPHSPYNDSDDHSDTFTGFSSDEIDEDETDSSDDDSSHEPQQNRLTTAGVVGGTIAGISGGLYFGLAGGGAGGEAAGAAGEAAVGLDQIAPPSVDATTGDIPIDIAEVVPGAQDAAGAGFNQAVETTGRIARTTATGATEGNIVEDA